MVLHKENVDNEDGKENTDNKSDEGNNGRRKSKVDLDTILIEEIGQFGLFQLRTLALALVAVVFSAFNGEYVFTTARVNSRCLIPECEDAASAEYAPEWILNAVPGTSLSSFDNCQRFGNASLPPDEFTIISGTCPATLFDTNTLLSCEHHVYEHSETVVYDFNLACKEWRRSLIGFIRTSGTFAALPITGYISDRWGRQFALAMNAFNAAWIGLIRYWANTYISFTIMEFFEAVFGGGVFSCTYILVLELVGPKYRVIAGAILTTFFSVGQVILALIAWAVPYWRHLTLALYIPQFITVCYFWLLTESVRWYMSKGRYEESETLLKKVAQVNGKQLSEKSLQALQQTSEDERKKKVLEKEQKANEPWLIVLVFRHKRILIRCLVSPVWWITTTMIFYGLSINAVNMSGNAYVNYMAVAAAEIPGYWIALLLMERVGRKPVLIGAYWICSACQIAYIFMPNDLYLPSLMVYLIGMISISAVVTSIYTYTAELYPTRYRHSLFAFSSMVGRLGSVIAPLTPALGVATFAEMPFVVFAGFALLSGCLVLVTPETHGTKLPDTMEEASDIGLTAERI